MLVLVAGCAVVAVTGGPASAAPITAVYDINTKTLAVTGTSAAETLSVSASGSNISVVGPSFVADPDGPGTNCSLLNATTVLCTDSSVDLLVVNALGSADTINDLRGSSDDDVDTLNGGDGNDTITYAPATVQSALDVDLHGDADNDALTYVPKSPDPDSEVNLEGATGSDTLTKNLSSNGTGEARLSGGDGNDTLNAGAGALAPLDNGGPGDDTYNGGGSSDSFEAANEPGADTYNGGGQEPDGRDSISYGAFFVPVSLSANGVADDGPTGEHDNILGVEQIRGGQAGNTIIGGPGDERLLGGNGKDFIDGRGGADQLLGSDGDDVLIGGAGADNLDGEGHNDRIVARDGVAPNDQSQCGSGTDLLELDASDGFAIDCETKSAGPAPAVSGPGKVKVKGKSATLSVNCPATAVTSCEGQLELSASLAKGKKAKTIGHASLSGGSGATITVSVKLNKKALALLAKHGKLKATLTVTAADAASPLPGATASVTLKGKKKH